MSQNTLTSTEISDTIKALRKLSKNMWWTWNQEAQEVFQELSPRGWKNLHHNAVAVLHEVSDSELKARLQDRRLFSKVQLALEKFTAYMTDENTWGQQHAPAFLEKPVAYFSAEFGFHETLPIAAGGLGILAGDHAKSTSDLGLGFVGISLFYREGYFQQSINHENWQTEYYTLLNPENLPIEPVLDSNGQQLVCSVEIAMGTVRFHAWKVNVGRNPVLLIDANRPENEPHYRDLTLRVYGGDSSTRIMQEILLGVGGVRLLRALGIQPSVFHMNEGHAAFLSLELIREHLTQGTSFNKALELSRQACVFTTHTPVAAGHDRFSSDLIELAAHRLRTDLKISSQELMALGRVNPNDNNEAFCMTVLALKTSRAANGVSELHGQVSRDMWRQLYPDKAVDQVPIGHITNGIHLLGWMTGALRKFWRAKLCADDSMPSAAGTTPSQPVTALNWEREIEKPEFWSQLENPDFISDEEIWALRYTLRRELIEFARRSLLIQGQHVSKNNFITYDHLLDVDTLTIGFARRFAVYKRAPLIFQQFARIASLARNISRPVQFIFAGKAHPRDDEGKRFIQQIIHLSKYSELKGHLVFIENYDIEIAQRMVAGCDVWLNNPRRPLEASGTSGQKVSCHGGLNLSILDGWWREGYDGANGFAIGADTHADNVDEQDRLDSESLYQVLSEQVVPCFYERDSNGIPREWIRRIRHSMATLVPQYNTSRMVQEYAKKYYTQT
jgi:glycogen phosphorylase